MVVSFSVVVRGGIIVFVTHPDFIPVTFKKFKTTLAAGVCSCHGVPVCAACHGIGEVEAGITGGFVQTGTSPDGEAVGHPTWVKRNPNAGELTLNFNPLMPLWSIASCGLCHGTGMPR